MEYEQKQGYCNQSLKTHFDKRSHIVLNRLCDELINGVMNCEFYSES